MEQGPMEREALSGEDRPAGQGGLLNLPDEPVEPSEAPLPPLETFLNDMEKDTLAEIGNISMGSSATALSLLVDQRVQITTPKLTLTTMQKLGEQYPLSSVITRINYQKGLQGENILILKEEDAALIAGLMMGMPAEDVSPSVGEMEMSAVSEAMNQMIGSSATAMSGFLGREIDISPPRLYRIDMKEEKVQMGGLAPEEPVLQLSFQLDIGDLLQSRLIQVVPFPFAKEITSSLLQDMITDEAVAGDLAAAEKEAAAPVAPAPTAVLPMADGDEGMLSGLQIDALAEVGNISLGSSATALSELINKKVNITAPQVTMTTMKEVSANYPIPCLVVMVNYIKGLDGNNVLIINKEDALVIVGLMMGMEPPEKPSELDELGLSAISEAMNQMMGSAATAMSDFLERAIDISPPELAYTESIGQNHLDALHYDENTPLVQVAFRMEVEGFIDSSLLQLIPLNFARNVTSFLLSSLNSEEAPALPDPIIGDDGEIETAGSAETAPQAVDGPQIPPEGAGRAVSPGVEEQAAVASFPGGATGVLSGGEYDKLNLIRDIPLEIQAVLGKTKIPLKKAFSLAPGHTISLNRFLGEPVEIYANRRLVATGEVVLVNGQFGVKITKMVRPKY